MIALAILLGATMSTDKITGTLIVEGRKVDLAKTAFGVSGKRCHEPDLLGIAISVNRVPDKPGQYAPALLGFTGTPGTTPLTVAHEVWVDDSDPKRGRSAVASAAAYVSPKDRGSSHTLPSKGWVRFIKLERMGPD